MANPNIVNVSDIRGKVATANLNSTSVTSLLDNPASSGKILKINTILATNYDGTNSSTLSIYYFNEDSLGGAADPIISTVDVPADSTVVVIDKNSSIYLEEDRSIGCEAGTANVVSTLVSYEEIS